MKGQSNVVTLPGPDARAGETPPGDAEQFRNKKKPPGAEKERDSNG